MGFLDSWAARMAPSKPTYDRHDALSFFSYGGNTYPLTGMTSWQPETAEPISMEFASFVDGAFKSDGVVFALEQVRYSVFSEARFLYQRLRNSRPGDLWGDPSLGILETPWAGGTTGDLLARMILDADLAGNSYIVKNGDELVRLRPDWVEIILQDQFDERGRQLSLRRFGYAYYHGGKQSGAAPEYFTADEVCHFAPSPDPSGSYRGMSWITPVVREIQSDIQATKHKLKFFENAATPNVHVGFAEKMKLEDLKAYKEAMDDSHRGADNAYKTLYTAGGADVTVLGANLAQMDFKATQGAGETRLAAAAGVHPVIAGLSEGMQGSSLNAGNYQAAKRVFIDKTIRPLWRNAAGSLATLLEVPSDSRLWYDDRDIPFLREDIQDRANVQQTAAITIRNLVDAGFDPLSVVDAVNNEDMSMLSHSGLFSVQLQPANSGDTAAEEEPAPMMDEDEAPRWQPVINVHPPSVEVDNRTIHNDGEMIERAITESVESVADRTAEQLSSTLAERDEATEGLRAALAEQTEAVRELRAEVAKPKPLTRKRVITDEIGRITAVEEEQI